MICGLSMGGQIVTDILAKRKDICKYAVIESRESLFEDYYRDSAAITKENMTAFLKANAAYQLKEGIKESKAKTLILAGSKEPRIMKKSAEVLCKQIANAALEILPGYYHGDLSINHASEYIKKLDTFMHLIILCR